MTEDEMVGWHHQLDRHEFEQTPGVGEGQGSLACHSPWACKELDTTERLNLIEAHRMYFTCSYKNKLAPSWAPMPAHTHPHAQFHLSQDISALLCAQSCKYNIPPHSV